MRKLYSFVFLGLACISTLLSPTVKATVGCDQYLDNSPLTRTTVLGEERVNNGVYEGIGQQYNNVSGQISSVVFWGRVNPASGSATNTVVVKIRQENLGYPGVTLGSPVNVVVDSSSTPQMFTAVFASPVSVSGNIIITIEPFSPVADDFFIQRNTHPDGQLLYLNKLKQASQWFKNLAAGGDTTLNFDFLILPVRSVSLTASFTHSAVGNTTNFTNTSANATSYLWEFGDGDTSTAASPSHNYAASGTYNVRLKAYRQGINGCVDSVTNSVPVVITGISQTPAKKGLILASTMVRDILTVESGVRTSLRIVDVLGNPVAKVELKANEPTQVRIDNLKPGVYLINSDIYKSVRFVKTR